MSIGIGVIWCPAHCIMSLSKNRRDYSNQNGSLCWSFKSQEPLVFQPEFHLCSYTLLKFIEYAGIVL